jgi:phosphate transport system substrate-binding protein
MSKRWIVRIAILAGMLVSCRLFPSPTLTSTVPPAATRSPSPSATPVPTLSPTPDVEAMRATIAHDYPRVDGSTSALPLQRVVACKLLGLPCVWIEGFWSAATVVPDVTRTDTPELAEPINGITHNGTHGAYVNLIEAQADFILVARPPSEDELRAARESGVTLDVQPVALDAFVFLVNAENPIDGLPMETVRDIYAGRITRWADGDLKGESISTYQRNPNSGSQELMEKLVMRSTPMVDSPDMILESMMGPFNAVGEDRLGIGYSVYYYAVFMLPTPQVKLIAIDGVAPTSANIADRIYPLTTEVYAVVREDMPQDSTAVILRNWLLTNDGQAAVAESGYIPLTGSMPDDTFAIYLVDEATSTAELAETVLEDLELKETSIISADDIISYTRESHQIELASAAYGRLLADLDRVGTSGRPFVVCVGSQRIYAGAFWTPVSSQSFDGIAIVLLPNEEHTIRIQLGYPESLELFRGFDLRADPRILRSLGEAGKLQ